ncbi:MAG: signal peptidase I [Bacilli bacterium]|nr:signal peptidase I [Bacilli bacterium]
MKKVWLLIKKIISDLVILVLAIFFIIAIYGFINIKILKKDYVNLFGYTYFDIITGSMEDTINVHDMVFVKITEDVKEGDIISFKSEDMIITHRVYKVDDDLIITKGDANNTLDKPIKKDQVIGKVVKIGRRYGLVLKTLMTPIVLISLFATVVLFCIYFSIEEK